MLRHCIISNKYVNCGTLEYMNRTERAILNAAATVLGQDPSATMTRVAEEAGVSRMTLHRYFGNRRALIEGAFHELIRKANLVVDEAMTASDDPSAQLEHMLKGDTQLGDFSFLQQLWNEQLDPSILSEGESLNAVLNTLFDTLKAEGAIAPHLSTSWLNHLYFAVLGAAWQAQRDGSVAPNDLPELAWASFSHGVMTPG
jgi:AcrR family transcriptional regulator